MTIYLLDGSGNQIASTTTDADGKYAFADLKPGVYGVDEVQPAGYLEGGDRVGSAGGTLDGPDRTLGAQLGSGVSGVNYDFCEDAAGDDFRLRLPGRSADRAPARRPAAEHPRASATAQLTPDDTRLAGVELQLCDGSGVPLSDAHGNPITTMTDANGYYEFDDAVSGRVFDRAKPRPAGICPASTRRAAKGGLVVNRYSTSSMRRILSTLAVNPSGSAIVQIPINPGDAAVQYNFSEVLIQTQHTAAEQPADSRRRRRRPPPTPPLPPPRGAAVRRIPARRGMPY